LRKQILTGHKVNHAAMLAEEALLDALWSLAPQVVTDAGRADFDERVRLSATWREFRKLWWPMLTPERLLARLADAELLTRLAGPLLTPAQVAAVAASLAHAHDWATEATPRANWSISDVALLDELAGLLGPASANDEDELPVFIEGGDDVSEVVTTYERGFSRPQTLDEDPEDTYAHVLIDEAQDITPMQWRMLRRRGPQASWTLVGDPAQSSYPFPRDTAQAISEIIGKGERRDFRLSTNYRSPKEVFDLAGRYISCHVPDADLPQAVRETGVWPLLLTAKPEALLSTIATQLQQLATTVGGSIAVIAPPSRGPELYRTLPDLPEWDATRMSLISALRAKGLEYDAVIVVAPDEIVSETPGGARVLYVDLTRATQRLVTIDVSDGRPGVWRESLA
jgi:hypothetical protein